MRVSIIDNNDMGENSLDPIKQQLLSRKAELEEELSKISTTDEEGRDANYEDIEDDDDVNAQEVSAYSERVSLVATLSKHLDDVNKSLEKIEKGEYGKCKYCQKEINPKRLLARPSSGSCIECKATLQGENR